MNITILQDLLKVSKELKSDYVYINGNDIYGVDDSFIYIKYMQFDNIYNINICFCVTSMATFLKNVCLNEIKLVNPNLLYSSFDNTLEINNITMINKIEAMIININNLKMKQTSVQNEPVRGIPEFEYVLESKSADGTGIFVYDKYVMTIFKNLIPLKKSDTVLLTIHDIDEKMFLSNFTVQRRKLKIEVYIMYLHL